MCATACLLLPVIVWCRKVVYCLLLPTSPAAGSASNSGEGPVCYCLPHQHQGQLVTVTKGLPATAYLTSSREQQRWRVLRCTLAIGARLPLPATTARTCTQHTGVAPTQQQTRKDRQIPETKAPHEPQHRLSPARPPHHLGPERGSPSRLPAACGHDPTAHVMHDSAPPL